MHLEVYSIHYKIEVLTSILNANENNVSLKIDKWKIQYKLWSKIYAQ